MSLRHTITTCAFAATLLATANLRAQQYDLFWHTIDGGPAAPGISTDGRPGGFILTGTIGQPDAGVLAGNSFELSGGFWSVTATCTCPGDLNHDGTRNGRDVQSFVACAIGASGACSCADMDGAGGLTPQDINTFVADLLAGIPCP